jgi:cyclic pyranopterin phosphate synthase
LTIMSLAKYSLTQEQRSKEGDVIGVARVAGILAAKKNSELIPLCYPICISRVDIDFEFYGNGGLGCSGTRFVVTVKSVCKSGLEMEAFDCGHGSGASRI